MVLEAVLYFVLGFLSAGLIALMVSPAIWNRAVILTKRKIESSTPLSLNEIQADKDQLRAEFAMSTRRLEMNLDELRQKAATQIADISRKRDEIVQYDAEKAERLGEIRELESKSSELGRRLEDREIQLEETSQRLDTLQNQYVQTLEEMSTMRSQLSSKDDELASQRIELAARETRIDALNQPVDSSAENKNGVPALRLELVKLKEDLAREKAKVEEANKAYEKAKQDALNAAEKMRNKDSELNLTREDGSKDAEALNKLNKELLNEREKVIDLEANLASQTLQMEALLKDPSGKNVDKAVKQVSSQVRDMQKNLEKVKAERDDLKHALDNISTNAGEQWNDERKHNALLRERMNDMAAKIAAMTAEVEGPGSEINKLLQQDAKTKKRATKASSKSSNDDNNSSNSQVSLAERIRAIQQVSETRR